MRLISLVLLVLPALFSGCSVSDPNYADSTPHKSRAVAPPDSFAVWMPIDTLKYPASPISSFLFVRDVPLWSGELYAPDSLLPGPYSDNDVWAAAEIVPWPSFSDRWINPHGTNYVFQVDVDCSDLPTMVITDLLLLKVPQSVNVHHWMSSLNSDITSISRPFREVPVDTFKAFSADVEPIDVHIEPVKSLRPSPRNIYSLKYKLRIDRLIFENGIGVHKIETGEHSCFPGDGWGLTIPSSG